MSAIVLEPDLGIEAAPRLHAQLAPALAAKKQVALDAAAVSRLHGASMQVLVAFVRARGAAGRKTRIDDPSPALRDAARAMGLASTLGLDS